MKYGYARVSSKTQKIDRQEKCLLEAGIKPHNVFIDEVSGMSFKRPAYTKLVRKLKKGDELYIKSIDRMGRNYEEIISQWKMLTVKKEVSIIVLDFPLLNTKEQQSNLTRKFLLDLVLQVLSYVAQIERENIKQRQKEGIRIAQEKGIKFGRPEIDLPPNFEEIKQLWKEKKMSIREAAKELGVSHSTFWRWLKRF